MNKIIEYIRNSKVKYIWLFVVISIIFTSCYVEKDNENSELLSLNQTQDVESSDDGINNKSVDENEIADEVASDENENIPDGKDEYQSYDDRTIALIDRANDGDVDAMNTLAYYYFNGLYVEQDYKKSLDWSIKSAEGGNLASMFNVGYNYYYGYAGDVDYDLAFQWYERAANKMFPKALNALGHMYYEGIGVEKNVDKALEYTMQSAGFLHNYSFSNMGSIIDDEELSGDSNFWYRLAAKNYMFHSGSNNILYENLLNGEIHIEANQNFEEQVIPPELIKDILFRFYSGTLYDYLETSNIEYKNFDINDLNVEDDTLQMISPRRWYDSNYFIDVNGDNINEVVCFKLDGTIGISSFQLLKLENDKYVLDDEFSSMSLMHGINGFVNFEDKKYFVVANIDIGNRSIFGVSIYSLEDFKLADSVLIKTKEISVEYMKTFQLSSDYDDLNTAVESRIDKMFVEKYNSILYEHVNESIILDVDINNDGKVEHYDFESIYWGTINRPISLEFREGLNSEDDLSIIYNVLNFNDLVIPIGLEVFTIDDVNFVSLLGYEHGTNNYCFTTFELVDSETKVILNHLITLEEIFDIIDDNDFFTFK